MRVWTVVACATSRRGVAQFATLTLRAMTCLCVLSGGGTYVKSRVSTSQAPSIVGDNSDRVRAHPDRSLDRPARVWIGEADRACDLDRRTVSNGPVTAQSSSAISSASSVSCTVSCEKCGRDGHYILARLIRRRGRNAKLIDWIDELTADCSKRIAYNLNDPCGVRCPGLRKVL